MSDFYANNDYRNYLQHHGIKGQRWGKQNGPPYPLSDKLHNFVIKRQAKAKEKKREKILHDPRKLAKHAPEFTKEEIDAAVDKIESVNRAKALAGPTKREIRKAHKEADKEAAKREKERNKARKIEDDRLTRKIEKYAPDVESLQMNVKKFNQAELNEALNRLNAKERMVDVQISKLNRPKKYLDVGVGYLETIGRGVSAVFKLKDALESQNPNILTKDERHKMFLEKLRDEGTLPKELLLNEHDIKVYKTKADIASKEKKQAREAEAKREENLRKAEKEEKAQKKADKRAKLQAEAEAKRTEAEAKRAKAQANLMDAEAKRAEAQANFFNTKAEVERAVNVAEDCAFTPISKVPNEAADFIGRYVTNQERIIRTISAEVLSTGLPASKKFSRLHFRI